MSTFYSEEVITLFIMIPIFTYSSPIPMYIGDTIIGANGTGRFVVGNT